MRRAVSNFTVVCTALAGVLTVAAYTNGTPPRLVTAALFLWCCSGGAFYADLKYGQEAV